MSGQLELVIRDLLVWLDRHQWRGFDPYDGLRTGLIRPQGWRARQAVVQIYKHSPVDLRRLSGAKAYEMAKATAVGLSAAVSLGDDPLRDMLLERLLVARLDSGLWGYEFDVQTRWAFYPSGSPNVIVSSFALFGLLDDGRERAMIGEASDAIASTFLRRGPGGPYFAYVVDSDILIHNANLLASAALARAGRLLDRRDLLDLALDTARVSVAAQSADGAWPYGESPNLGWIDGFHTAYNLVALEMLGGDEHRRPLELGLEFYLEELFDDRGRPRLRSDRRGFLEVHTVGTALWCLARLVDLNDSVSAVLRGCVGHALRLRRSDGAFATTTLNRIPYLRWGQAHMLLGLASVRGLS